MFSLSQNLNKEFAGCNRLRMHVDYNEKDNTLVFKYFRQTLLTLIKDEPDFPIAEVKKILRYVAEAINDFHSKDWIHLGMMRMAHRMVF